MKLSLFVIIFCLGASSMALANPKQVIEISNVRLTAGGNMLDLRYRVTNLVKATAVLKKGLKPYLIEEKTGVQHYVPTPGKVGALRQLPAKPSIDKTYFMIFANPGRRIKSGDLVTVVLGDFKVRHVAIQ